MRVLCSTKTSGRTGFAIVLTAPALWSDCAFRSRELNRQRIDRPSQAASRARRVETSG